MYITWCRRSKAIWLICILFLLILSQCKSIHNDPVGDPIVPSDSLVVDLLTPPPSTTGHFNAVRFIESVLYIVGENGLIASGNLISGYNIHYHPYGVTFWDILYANGTVLVFGSFGVIYRKDGDSQWTTVTQDSIAAGLRYRKADVDGANRIWALGDNTFLHYSLDNGLTWQQYFQQNMNQYRAFTAIRFFPGGRGFLTTGTVGFWTTNNGIEWQGIRAINHTVNDILFVSPQEMYLACYGGDILRSLDFGTTWSSVNLSCVENESFYKVVQLGDRTFLAVSGYTDSLESRRGRVWRSKNGLDWWCIHDTNQEIRDITVDSSGLIIICGTNSFLATIRRQ